ncbi:concanavalin A-like lectin/glucanase domain-containing protein [Lophiotrema nucula]|uniref:Concanavalin A-like lectin/glucanase domain-containing protein n=1 Tax=Lophiotrema nucula TaxID=690887 RepID=A0A6A5YWI9_9PLEO|nr:concanavalin A-like lectin/glucanase domain-containing protein [Lophiotrema nucula]
MFILLRDAVAAMPWLILAMSHTTTAYCECGYSVNKTSDSNYAIYTDLMENDFLHTATDNMTEVGWAPQEYNMTAEQARGPYGKEFHVENIDTNPLKNNWDWAGGSTEGGEAGLRLWVRGDHSHGYVSGAEMATVRNDSFYGSFRVGMKLASTTGTCGAFFWFYNNSQEIDMEFLNRQFNESAGGMGAVNLVLQSPQSVKDGFDAANTSDFKLQALNFNPDDKFHEYRFDWSPERVAFYVDGKLVQEMTENVPTSAGKLFMNHWSNGDPLWSAGPPDTDTSIVVSYIKAYFNSSDTTRQKAYTSRCAKYDASKVCQIPDQTVPPDPSGADGNATAKTYFFTLDGGDHAPGQTTYKTTNSVKSSAMSLFGSVGASIAYLPLMIALLSSALML